MGTDPSSIASWVPGQVVRAYTLLREIARGGMGEIWLAKHKGAAGFERLVVLKRIIASADEEPAFIEMFLDEARIASHLHHPNVVQVSELGQEGTSYFMVMEYLAGQSLGRVARRFEKSVGPLPTTVSVEIIAAAARGLGYAHRRAASDGQPLHIVHRDVSPQNIMVTYDGLTKVLDFGIAKASGRLARTRTGVVKGKVSYMSPEQATGLPVAATSDVFSLGVILFELLSGTRAWGDLDDFAILQRLAKRTPLPKLATHDSVDGELVRIVSKAVEVQEPNRYVDGDELADALEAWLRKQRRDDLSLRQLMRTCFAPEIEQMSATPAPADAPMTESSESLPMGRVVPQRNRLLITALAGAIAVASGALVTLVLKTPPKQTVQVISTAADVDAGTVVDAGVVAAVEPIVIDAGIPAVVVVIDAGTEPVAVAPIAPPVAPQRRRGRLTLDTDPWTQVFEGKRRLGETPLIDVPLPAGKHWLRLVNTVDRIDTVIEVDVPSDGVLVKKLAF